jgi:hypothetical protein
MGGTAKALSFRKRMKSHEQILLAAIMALVVSPATAEEQQQQRGDWQFYVTSGATGGPYGFIVNTRTAEVAFCNAATDCFVLPWRQAPIK